MKLVFATLDFTHVTNNQAIKEQGKIICLKSGKGWFWVDKGKFPSRQDLAIITDVKTFDLQTSENRMIPDKDEFIISNGGV
jgi:hypothetical protein